MGRSSGNFTLCERKASFPLLYLRRGGAKRRGGQVLPVGEANIGDPVTLPARKTGFDILAFEADGCSTKPRCIDIFEHVDVDDRIEMLRDLAGDERHGAAPRAHVKRGRPSSESVLRHERGISNRDRQPGIWVRSPDSSVLHAESATARARRNLGRVAFPFELEGDIAAVAFTFDEHVDVGASRGLHVLVNDGPARSTMMTRRWWPVRSTYS